MTKKELLKNTEKIATAWAFFMSSEFCKPGVENVREQFLKFFCGFEHWLPKEEYWETLIKSAEKHSKEREKIKEAL